MWNQLTAERYASSAHNDLTWSNSFTGTYRGYKHSLLYVQGCMKDLQKKISYIAKNCTTMTKHMTFQKDQLYTMHEYMQMKLAVIS